MSLSSRPRVLRAAAWAAVLAAALGVLALYSRPEFLVLIADQVWACF